MGGGVHRKGSHFTNSKRTPQRKSRKRKRTTEIEDFLYEMVWSRYVPLVSDKASDIEAMLETVEVKVLLSKYA